MINSSTSWFEFGEVKGQCLWPMASWVEVIGRALIPLERAARTRCSGQGCYWQPQWLHSAKDSSRAEGVPATARLDCASVPGAMPVIVTQQKMCTLGSQCNVSLNSLCWTGLTWAMILQVTMSWAGLPSPAAVPQWPAPAWQQWWVQAQDQAGVELEWTLLSSYAASQQRCWLMQLKFNADPDFILLRL